MDPLETGKALLMLGGLAGIYLKMNQAMRAMTGRGESREISNDPLRVQETIRPATILDVERVEVRVLRVEKEIREMKRDTDDFREKLRADIAAAKDSMHDKMSEMSDDVRELTRAVGRLEGH